MYAGPPNYLITVSNYRRFPFAHELISIIWDQPLELRDKPLIQIFLGLLRDESTLILFQSNLYRLLGVFMLGPPEAGRERINFKLLLRFPPPPHLWRLYPSNRQV